MKNFLNGLVAHLEDGDLSPKTIKPYEGELKDIPKLTAQYPALYVMLKGGSPFGVEAEQSIMLVFVTKSRVYRANKDQTNIDMVDEVGNYLNENYTFEYNGKSFYLDAGSNIMVDSMMINQKFSIYSITIQVHRS